MRPHAGAFSVTINEVCASPGVVGAEALLCIFFAFGRLRCAGPAAVVITRISAPCCPAHRWNPPAADVVYQPFEELLASISIPAAKPFDNKPRHNYPTVLHRFEQFHRVPTATRS